MYNITIQGGSTYQIELGKDQTGTINGEPVKIDMVDLGLGAYHILRGNESFRVEVLKLDRTAKQVVLRINGHVYTADVRDKFDLLAEEMGLTGAGAGALKEFKAPMPGLVLDICVEPGSKVQKGEALAVLEAMKMENILKAPGEGIVKSILIQKRQAVEKNQVMITFE